MIDPGPSDPAHLDAVAAAAGRDAEGIVLTHGHPDHAEGAPALAERLGGVEVVRPEGGTTVGPFSVIATPGHSPDHVSLLFGRVLFAGDMVLGAGSVFVGGDEGSMAAYLDSLRRLLELDLDAILPGHGPVVWEPRAKLEEYLAHRLDRERRVLEAVDGRRRHARRGARPGVERDRSRRRAVPAARRGPHARRASREAVRRWTLAGRAFAPTMSRCRSSLHPAPPSAPRTPTANPWPSACVSRRSTAGSTRRSSRSGWRPSTRRAGCPTSTGSWPTSCRRRHRRLLRRPFRTTSRAGASRPRTGSPWRRWSPASSGWPGSARSSR